MSDSFTAFNRGCYNFATYLLGGKSTLFYQRDEKKELSGAFLMECFKIKLKY